MDPVRRNEQGISRLGDHRRTATFPITRRVFVSSRTHHFLHTWKGTDVLLKCRPRDATCGRGETVPDRASRS
jgi:hypothetical protein